MRGYVLVAALALPACHCADIDTMMHQPKSLPYGENRLFSDGRAMRMPPEGAVPRERDLAADIPPPVVTPELLTLGRERFDIVCATCHGIVGDGDSIVGSKMALRPPPSLHEPRLRALSSDQLYLVIRDGYGLMPRYAAQLAPHERWAVIAYVRALQVSQALPIADAPEELRRQLEATR